MRLRNLIAKNIFDGDYQNTNTVSFNLRAKRIAPLKEMIIEAYRKYRQVKIIDVGGHKGYWKIMPKNFLQENKVKITVVNMPGVNAFEDDEMFRFVEGNGCNLSEFENASFHIGHSNSVIEHVGGWDEMKKLASEISRISNGYYVQTPYFWFPMEPHFMFPLFHWLPEPVRVSLIMNFKLGRRVRNKNINRAVYLIEHTHLIDKKMFSELFKDAQIKFERFFLIPKSMLAIKKMVPNNHLSQVK